MPFIDKTNRNCAVLD